MDPNNIGPPSMWSNPDWWESIIAVFVGACGLIAWVMKVWIINPANKRADETRGTLVKIDSEMSKVAEEVKGIRIGMESINSSVHSAHHRIDEVTHRITRIEDVFLKNQ